MGELISLAHHRAERVRLELARIAPPTFYFDLACPLSYLESESVERQLGDVRWVPVSTFALRGAEPPPDDEAWAERRAAQRRATERPASERRAAERRALELHLPLVWPEREQPTAPAALRAACFAVERGAGARFALAAGRLAFSGGFDLEDPEVLAEAAAAAGLPLEDTLAAACDPRHDAEIEHSAALLREHRVAMLPAVRTGETWHHGIGAVTSAAALAGWRRHSGSPLAPAG